ncbi:MAG: modification methylase HphIB, partial [Bacteroidetes bacterium HGW-Bacteroidetes-23]
KNNVSYNDDVFNLLDNIKADIIYLDPPYTGTMNNYFGFYGLIDDFIESSQTVPFENNFVDRKTVGLLFDKLFSKLSNFKYWILSYNNSSFPTKNELLYLLNKYSNNVQVIERKHNYKITGKEKKEANKEYLFIVKNELYQENTKENYATAEL